MPFAVFFEGTVEMFGPPGVAGQRPACTEGSGGLVPAKGRLFAVARLVLIGGRRRGIRLFASLS